MDSAISTLVQIQGVKGYSLFDPQGACVTHQMPPPYEPILLHQVFLELRSAFDAVRSFDDGGDIDSFVGRYENGCLVLRPVATHSLLLLTAPEVNMAMLNVGFKVAQLKLERAVAASPPPSTSAVKVDSTSSLRANGELSLSPMNESRVPADAVGANVMNDVVKLLATHIGPLAKVVVKKELAAIGLHPQTVGASQYDDVITVLAKKIPDATGRDRFMKAAKSFLYRT